MNTTTELVPSVSITNLANQRTAVIKRIRTALDLLAEAEQLARIAHLGFPRLVLDNSYAHWGSTTVTGEYAKRAEAEQAILHTIDAKGWNHLLNESGLRTFMDARAPARSGASRLPTATYPSSRRPTSKRRSPSCTVPGATCSSAVCSNASDIYPGTTRPTSPSASASGSF